MHTQVMKIISVAFSGVLSDPNIGGCMRIYLGMKSVSR